MDPRWLFLFPLHREASSFRARCPNAKIEIIGAGTVAAKNHATRYIESHQPTAVILAGFAGALIDGLAVGDVYVASEVIDDANEVRLKPTLQLRSKTPKVRIITTNRIEGDPVKKRFKGQHFQAGLIDMESMQIARVCKERGIPWAVVRVVSDTVDTTVSEQLIDLITANGRVSIMRALFAVIKNPRLLVEFRRLARDTRLAADRLGDELAEIARSHRES